jgi:hypothetical protein
MDPPKAENISRLAEHTLDTNTTTLNLESFVSRVKFALITYSPPAADRKLCAHLNG